MNLPSATATQSEHARPNLSPAALLLTFGLVLTALAYIGTLRFAFVYDDLPQIVANPAIQSWRYVPGYFIHHVWSHIYPTWPGNYYRPLFLLWLRLNHAVFGLHPFGWHFTTLAAHLGVTAMVFWLARRLTRDDAAAAIAATLFGLHPAHIEVVAWVSGVSEPLLGLLFIPAFVFYLDARERPQQRARWLTLSWIFYLLALLAKETAIVLPGLIVAYEWLRERKHGDGEPSRARASLIAALPYAAISIGYIAVRQLVLKAFAHPEGGVTPLAVVLTWPSLLWFCARHLVGAARYSLFYDTPYVLTPGVSDFWLPLAAVLLLALALLVWSRSRTEGRAAALASLWLLLPLAPPVASIGIFGNGEIAHDRYLYLPSIGLVILVAMAIRRIGNARVDAGDLAREAERRSAQNMGESPASTRPASTLPLPQIAVTVVLALALGTATIVQSVHWANNLLLYYYGIQTAPHNSLARIHLGTEMLSRGDAASALRLYQEGHDLAPNTWSANFVLGFVNFILGRYGEAEKWLRESARITPLNPNQYLYLGLALMNQGRLDEAEANVRHGAELWPQGAGFHYGLGLIRQKRGDIAGARAEYERELQIDPTSGARQNLQQLQ